MRWSSCMCQKKFLLFLLNIYDFLDLLHFFMIYIMDMATLYVHRWQCFYFSKSRQFCVLFLYPLTVFCVFSVNSCVIHHGNLFKGLVFIFSAQTWAFFGPFISFQHAMFITREVWRGGSFWGVCGSERNRSLGPPTPGERFVMLLQRKLHVYTDFSDSSIDLNLGLSPQVPLLSAILVFDLSWSEPCMLIE